MSSRCYHLTSSGFRASSFAWHTLFLLGGSNVLGKVVESSQLLDHMVHFLKHALPANRILVAAEVFAAACVMATFVSHSVAAIVVVPIIAHVGKGEGGERRLRAGEGGFGAGNSEEPFLMPVKTNPFRALPLAALIARFRGRAGV